MKEPSGDRRGTVSKKTKKTASVKTSDDAWVKKNMMAAGDPETADVALLKDEIRRLQRRDTQQQGIRTLIREAVHETWRRPPTLVMPKEPKSTGKGNEEVAVLHISDVQWGKVTEDYNSLVAAKRLMDLATRTVEVTEVRRTAAKIDTIHVYLGGDMVEGETIFSKQVWEIDSPVLTQTKACASTVASIGLYLLKHFKRVKFCTVPGNHGRSAPRSTQASSASNWDNASYDFAKTMLLGTDDYPHKDIRARCEFDVSETWYYLDRVLGWGNLMVHGDQISGGFAGYPFYGVGRKALGWIDTIPATWTYLWLGHFHTYGRLVINKREWLANGSPESKNQFAAQNLAACGDPVQRLAFFNARLGLISDVPIYLGERVVK